jgi:hypothetical protein
VNNDKAFAIYALVLIGGVASVVTASVMAGYATFPTPLVFLEHVSLSLAFRWAYKTIGGFDMGDWSVLGDKVAEPVPAGETASDMGVHAGANI